MTTSPFPTVGCTCFRLKKLTRAVSRLYDQHMAAVGLKTTQYSLLKCVATQSLPIAELASRLHAERTTLTRNLKPLLDAGWVVLAAGLDSRQRIVTITAGGRDLLKRARQAWRHAQNHIEQTLGLTFVHDLNLQLDTALLLMEDRTHDTAK